MDIDILYKAHREARRFLERIDELEERLNELPLDDKSNSPETEPRKMLIFSGCKETAAVKRASMDLTRALADLRRSTP
jgi:hypothetical protein